MLSTTSKVTPVIVDVVTGSFVSLDPNVNNLLFWDDGKIKFKFVIVPECPFFTIKYSSIEELIVTLFKSVLPPLISIPSSFTIKLLNGSVDIGGDNTISEDTNIVKDTNVSNVDQDYLIIDSHQNGTINSLHNLMSSSGPSASLIQFIETNNKCTTTFVDGSYSVSGTYKKNNNAVKNFWKNLFDLYFHLLHLFV